MKGGGVFDANAIEASNCPVINQYAEACNDDDALACHDNPSLQAVTRYSAALASKSSK